MPERKEHRTQPSIPVDAASVASGISVRTVNGPIDEEIPPRSVNVKGGNREAPRAYAMPGHATIGSA